VQLVGIQIYNGIYSSFFSLQNAVCFIILTYLVPVLFTFYIQSVPNKKNSGAKRLNESVRLYTETELEICVSVPKSRN